MKLPWSRKLETRAGTTFTDAQLAALTAKADGNGLVTHTAVGALEACAGVIGRGFASAEVGGRSVVAEALNPDVLEMVGRSLIRRGEILLYVDTTGDRLLLLPATSYDIQGGPNPSTWEYNLMLNGPSGTISYTGVGADSVIHIKYAVDPVEPWRGNAPMDVARLSGRLSAETVNALADESSTPVGQLMGLPVDGDDPTVTLLKSDMKTSKGKMAFLQTGDWGNVGEGYADLTPKRFGAAPTEHLVELLKVSSSEVYAACGFNPALFISGDSASLRESWRLALFGVVAPLAVKVTSELSYKLETDVTLGFEEMKASDVQGRARAFMTMVGAGMELERAVALSGLLVE